MSDTALAAIVLVHGSWGGPWVWDGVIAEAGAAADRMRPVALEGVANGYEADTPPSATSRSSATFSERTRSAGRRSRGTAMAASS